jgi:hypothetical protein
MRARRRAAGFPTSCINLWLVKDEGFAVAHSDECFTQCRSASR